MTSSNTPINVSAELKALQHDMKNQKMKRLPSNTTIQRRPLHHAPIASPFAGAGVQKVVYVSTRTPLMAAVKRVRRMLFEIEKRALQEPNKIALATRSLAILGEVSARLAKANEEVLVKASGRAMSQALKVGDWFRNKEKEIACTVEVRTGSVQAVDDIVEKEDPTEGIDDDHDLEESEAGNHTTTLEGGETTMELLGGSTKSLTEDVDQEIQSKKEEQGQVPLEDDTQRKKRKRSRRKRAAYDQDDVPEARLRWVKTVEVAISFKA